MKLGVLGLLPNVNTGGRTDPEVAGYAATLPPPLSLDQLTPALVGKVRELGFTGTGLPFLEEDPASITTENARRVGQVFRDAGVDLVEYGRYFTNLVHRDDGIRKGHIASLGEAIRVARAADCQAVVTGAGSLNETMTFFPHRDNYSQETLDRLIASLREAVKPAEDVGMILGLECHTVTPLRDARTARLVLDAVSSPALRVHLDPVNWMTWETVYNSGEATVAMFETLGAERLLGAHSKGVAVEDRFIIHLSETTTGLPDDLFDHATLLRLAATMPSDFYLVIEHATPEEMPGARDYLLKVAAQIGVSFE